VLHIASEPNKGTQVQVLYPRKDLKITGATAQPHF
jgi:hypothetical protein